MKAKNAMYAAVGAPIVAARALNARLEHLREEMESRGEGLSDRAQQVVEEWSREGREAMEKVSDGKVVDEFAAKVDFDQAKEQVGKLRDQLEEMLSTWRTSFRPENGEQAPARPDPAAKAARARTEKAEALHSTEEEPAEPVDAEAVLVEDPAPNFEAVESPTDSDETAPEIDEFETNGSGDDEEQV